MISQGSTMFTLLECPVGSTVPGSSASLLLSPSALMISNSPGQHQTTCSPGLESLLLCFNCRLHFIPPTCLLVNLFSPGLCIPYSHLCYSVDLLHCSIPQGWSQNHCRVGQCSNLVFSVFLYPPLLDPLKARCWCLPPLHIV